jgi:hypothetical protein
MKNETMKSGFDVLAQAFTAATPVQAAAGENWVQFWRGQNKMIDGMEEFATGWFARRHTATTTALEAAERLCAANSPADVLAELQTWTLGSLQRLSEDGLACQKQLMALFDQSAQAAAKMAELPGKSGKEEKSKAVPVVTAKAA